jgi:hypothetical protein
MTALTLDAAIPVSKYWVLVVSNDQPPDVNVGAVPGVAFFMLGLFRLI